MGCFSKRSKPKLLLLLYIADCVLGSCCFTPWHCIKLFHFCFLCFPLIYPLGKVLLILRNINQVSLGREQMLPNLFLYPANSTGETNTCVSERMRISPAWGWCMGFVSIRRTFDCKHQTNPMSSTKVYFLTFQEVWKLQMWCRWRAEWSHQGRPLKITSAHKVRGRKESRPSYTQWSPGVWLTSHPSYQGNRRPPLGLGQVPGSIWKEEWGDGY